MTPREAIDHALANGGATLRAITLEPVDYKRGFAVALAGWEARVPAYSSDDAKTVAYARLEHMLGVYALQARQRSTRVGLWLDGVELVFDLTRVHADPQDAYFAAVDAKQDAIFDFATCEAIETAEFGRRFNL